MADSGSLNRIGNFLRWRVRRALALIARLLPARRRSTVTRILCLVSGGLGDRLMALPALRSIRAGNPNARITVVWMDGPLEPVDGEFHHVIHHARRNLLSLLRTLPATWDMAYASSQAVFSVLTEGCMALCRAPIRIGPVSYPGSRGVYSQPYNFDTMAHATLVNCRPIDPCAGPQPLPYPVSLPDAGCATAPGRIAVHPGSRRGYEWKRWPHERFGELIRHLADEREVAVLLGPDEEFVLPPDSPIKAFRPPGATGLFTFLSGCSLLVANDSGPAHAAAALGVPVVVIFGPTNPIRVRPVYSRGEVVTGDAPCVPCFDTAQRCSHDLACLRGISVQRVLDTVHRVLAQP